ncbi:MAG: type II toxin-antitoxin system HicB family antitoxin [Chloroflexota bacterium]|nr:type II toxin-antitoxin system HicB family antitoxin [Chloroflexota bacterium]
MSKREKRLDKLRQNPVGVSTIKDLAYYLSLRYTVILTPEIDGWGAIIPDLRGCVGAGDTIVETLTMLEDAKLGWFASALKHGDVIPEPSKVELAA